MLIHNLSSIEDVKKIDIKKIAEKFTTRYNILRFIQNSI